MKKIYKHSIENIKDTDTFDNTFSIDYFEDISSKGVKIVYMCDLLESKRF